MNINNETRGVRNCNPCNIRRGTSQWVGLREEQTDPQFCQFIDMKQGLRAAFVLLRNYYEKRGCNTIHAIVHRWAPPQDGNDTEAYALSLSSYVGVHPQTPLKHPFRAYDTWKRLVYKMCWIESAYKPTWDELEQAYVTAFE